MRTFMVLLILLMSNVVQAREVGMNTIVDGMFIPCDGVSHNVVLSGYPVWSIARAYMSIETNTGGAAHAWITRPDGAQIGEVHGINPRPGSWVLFYHDRHYSPDWININGQITVGGVCGVSGTMYIYAVIYMY